jgi:hypothetical protein
MLNVEGPVSGAFAQSLIPNDGDKGVVSECQGGEIDVEFQSRAARDVGEQDPPGGVQPPPVSNQTAWILTTDIEVLKC